MLDYQLLVIQLGINYAGLPIVASKVSRFEPCRSYRQVRQCFRRLPKGQGSRIPLLGRGRREKKTLHRVSHLLIPELKQEHQQPAKMADPKPIRTNREVNCLCNVL